jgi:hypothetical protein
MILAMFFISLKIICVTACLALILIRNKNLDLANEVLGVFIAQNAPVSRLYDNFNWNCHRPCLAVAALAVSQTAFSNHKGNRNRCTILIPFSKMELVLGGHSHG